VADRVILFITFGLTVFADLVVAVNVGVILAVLQFLRRMVETVDTRPVGTRDLQAELAGLGQRELPPRVLVYEVNGPMFFGAVENFKRPLLEMRPTPQALILRLQRVPFMDFTGIHTLQEVIGKLRKRGVTVVLCEANSRVHLKLVRAGLLTGPDRGEYFESLRHALQHVGVGPDRGAGASSAGSRPETEQFQG
jgi:SulP family sulfate permease